MDLAACSPARLGALLEELLAIPSPTGSTQLLADAVAARLEGLGLTCSRTRRGGLRAVLPGRRSDEARAVVVHLDTVGAVVRRVRDDGRLELAPVGTWPARNAEGARVTVVTQGGRLRGTVLPTRTSGHVHGDAVDGQPSGWEHLRVRVDGPVAGVEPGDEVLLDPGTEVTETGYVVSRHLDDKAGLAAVLAALEAARAGEPPPVDCHLLFTSHEEVGSGASAGLPPEVAELVGVDIAPAGDGQATREEAVTVPALDAAGPFDRELRRRLLDLAREHGLPAVSDVFRFYRSDAAAAVEAGHDVRTALLCFGADATHGYERTHLDGLAALSRLVALYVGAPA